MDKGVDHNRVAVASDEPGPGRRSDLSAGATRVGGFEEGGPKYGSESDGSSRNSWLWPLKIRTVVSAVALLIVAAIAGAVWVSSFATWTEGSQQVDTATSERINFLYEDLAELRAPMPAMQAVARAAKPGILVGEAIDILNDANQALEPVKGDPRIAPAQQTLLAILDDLKKVQN